jgi:autotransporter-associated beta strand protein
MAKGASPSTIGCHLWYFGNGGGTSPSKAFTFDVEDVTESTAVDLTMNGDILRGIASTTDWSGAIVKSGAGTLLMNGKLTMTRPMQVNGGAFIFGDTGGLAEGADTVSPTSLVDNKVNVIDAAATSTQRDVVLAGATLGKTAGALAFDTLTVTGGGTLELGPTATMSFADSSAKAWSGRLTLAGWRARAVRFGTSAEGLTAEQCRLIRTAEGLKLHLDSDGYLVPIGFKFAVR